MDETKSGLSKSGLSNPTPDTSNSTKMPSDSEGSKLTNRGNGVEMTKDGENAAIIAKQTTISSGDLQRMNDFNDEHGDVGRAGSYRIDGTLTEV